MSFYRIRNIKANRGKKLKNGDSVPRTCAWCGERINIGDRSVNITSVWEGDFFNDHLHPECNLAANAVLREDDEVYFDGDWARGRTDDQGGLPPEFPPLFEEEWKVKGEQKS